MADISKITLPSGTTYNIKDQGARDLIDEMSGYTDFLGVTTTALTDGATTNPIKINNVDVTAKKGNIVTYGSAEFIFNGTAWQLFGDLSGLGDLAFKDSASGTVAVPKTYTTTVTPSTTSKYVASSSSGGGSATKGTVTVSPASSGTATYTPAGTVSTPTITVTPSTTSKYVATSATGGGSVTAGTKASCTLPVLTTSVSNETLTIGWSAGSFTQNTPTAVTLPSFSSQTIATGISSASSTQPSFTGTGVRLKTDSEVYTSVTMPSFSSQTIATGISSASTTTATTENKTVTVT
jgi:hypothetical protein